MKKDMPTLVIVFINQRNFLLFYPFFIMSPLSYPVHGFLEELGQGIQHIASRVDDLPTFVQRANDYREVMGEGFTFLNIPRSYYGVLSEKLLCEDVDGISEACASRVMEMCETLQTL